MCPWPGASVRTPDAGVRLPRSVERRRGADIGDGPPFCDVESRKALPHVPATVSNAQPTQSNVDLASSGEPHAWGSIPDPEGKTTMILFERDDALGAMSRALAASR